MVERKLQSVSKNSSDNDKIVEIEQTILLRQKRAEMMRIVQKEKSEARHYPSLTEEFFVGLRIV